MTPSAPIYPIGYEAIGRSGHWTNPYAAKVELAWKLHDDEIERQLASYQNGGEFDRELIDQRAEAAKIIEGLHDQAHKQHHCPHYWVSDSSGGQYWDGYGPADNIEERIICPRCGAEKPQQGE